MNETLFLSQFERTLGILTLSLGNDVYCMHGAQHGMILMAASA